MRKFVSRKQISLILFLGVFIIASCEAQNVPNDASTVVPSQYSTSTREGNTSTPVLTTPISSTGTREPAKTEIQNKPTTLSTIQSISVQMSEREYHANLKWLECEVPIDVNYDWGISEKCFGFPIPTWDDTDTARFGERFRREGHIWDDLRIIIDGDVYETDKQPGEPYILYKNGDVFVESMSGDTSYPPNRSLQNVGGKVVWELANPWQPTIILDGRDLRQENDLEGVYLPYNLGEKLIFVGNKDAKYFVNYDGKQLGPQYEEISIGYCCGPAAYSIRRVNGEYWFWATKENRYYLVVVGVRK